MNQEEQFFQNHAGRVRSQSPNFSSAALSGEPYAPVNQTQLPTVNLSKQTFSNPELPLQNMSDPNTISNTLTQTQNLSTRGARGINTTFPVSKSKNNMAILQPPRGRSNQFQSLPTRHAARTPPYQSSHSPSVHHILDKKQRELEMVNRMRIQTLEDIVQFKLRNLSQKKRANKFNRQTFSRDDLGALSNPSHEHEASPVQGANPRSSAKNLHKETKQYRTRTDNSPYQARSDMRADFAEVLSNRELYADNQQQSKKLVERYEQQIIEGQKREEALRMALEDVQVAWHQQQQENAAQISDLLKEREDLKDMVRQKDTQYSLLKVDYETQVTAEVEAAKQEINGKLFEKDMDLQKLDEEVQRLMILNEQLTQEKQQLSEQIGSVRESSLANLQQIQRELSQKMDHAQEADQQLAQLSEQFLQFREKKVQTETMLKSTVEDLEHQLALKQQQEDRAHEVVRLAAETEKLSIKSQFEVRLDHLTRERNQLAQINAQSTDKIMQLAEKVELLKLEKSNNPEVEDLKYQVQQMESDLNTKVQLRQENITLFARVEDLQAQIERLLTENQGLKETQKQMLDDTVIEMPSKTLRVEQLVSTAPPARAAPQSPKHEDMYQREYLRQKDELTQHRVAAFQSKQVADTLRQENNELKIKLEQLEDQRGDLHKQVRSLTKKLEMVQDENDSMVRDAESWKSEQKKMVEEVRDLQQEAKHLQSELNKYQDPSLISLEQERLTGPLKAIINDLESKVELHHREKAKFVEQVQRQVVQINHLQTQVSQSQMESISEARHYKSQAACSSVSFRGYSPAKPLRSSPNPLKRVNFQLGNNHYNQMDTLNTGTGPVTIEEEDQTSLGGEHPLKRNVTISDSVNAILYDLSPNCCIQQSRAPMNAVTEQESVYEESQQDLQEYKRASQDRFASRISSVKESLNLQ